MHCNNVTWFHLYHSPPVTEDIIPPSISPPRLSEPLLWSEYIANREAGVQVRATAVLIWFSFRSPCPIALLDFNLVGCRKLRWQKYSRRLPHPDNNISAAKTHFIKSDTHDRLPSVSNETATPFLLTHSAHFPLSGMPDLHKVFISCLTQQPPSAFLLCWSLRPAFPWGFLILNILCSHSQHSSLSGAARPGITARAEVNSLLWS